MYRYRYRYTTAYTEGAPNWEPPGGPAGRNNSQRLAKHRAPIRRSFPKVRGTSHRLGKSGPAKTPPPRVHPLRQRKGALGKGPPCFHVKIGRVETSLFLASPVLRSPALPCRIMRVDLSRRPTALLLECLLTDLLCNGSRLGRSSPQDLHLAKASFMCARAASISALREIRLALAPLHVRLRLL